MARSISIAFALASLVACGNDDGGSDAVDAAPATGIQGTVTYAGTAQGSLMLAAFTSFPPAGAPAGLAQETSPTFPATLVIDDLAPGTVHLLAMLDVDPASPTQPGPEDLTAWQMNVAVTAGGLAPVALTLQDP